MVREEASSSLPSGDEERDFVRGDDEVSDEDRNPRHKLSWRDILGDESMDKTRVPAKLDRSPRGRIIPTATARPSPPKMYSREEVIEMLRESKLRDGGNGEEGWTQVTSRSTKKKATSDARVMLGISKKKRKVFCWECKSSDHLSHQCPLGMTCHYCHQQGHRIAECPRNNPKVRRQREIESEEYKQRGESSFLEERRMVKRIFLPLTDELVKAKQEATRVTGALISGYGHPSVEDMIEGLKAMSDRMSKFR